MSLGNYCITAVGAKMHKNKKTSTKIKYAEQKCNFMNTDSKLKTT